MFKPIKTIILLIFLQTLTSCEEVITKRTEQKLAKNWGFGDLQESRNNLLCLFPDGKLTEIYNNIYQEGEWEFIPEKKQIVLHYKNTIDTVKVYRYQRGEITNYLKMDYKEYTRLEFYETAPMMEDYKKDPYYPTNNKWRVKPEREQTKKELKEKVRQFVQHNIYILNAALKRKSTTVNFTYAQGVIKIYDGGIGVTKIEDLSDDWKEHFYNEEQALQAREIYQKYLKNLGFKGKSSGSWIKDDHDILSLLLKRIERDLER